MRNEPAIVFDVDRMACKGAVTRTVWASTGDMQECEACSTRVAWDLTEHPVFGFQTCPFRNTTIEDAEGSR